MQKSPAPDCLPYNSKFEVAHVGPTSRGKIVILNLQALRAYAATLVLFHHSQRFYTDMGGSFGWFESIGRWGFTGVDIFFVLSGYVIARSISPRNGSVIRPADFLFRRFGRIYLGYWPFFFIALVTASLFYPQFLADKKIFASGFFINTLNRVFGRITCVVVDIRTLFLCSYRVDVGAPGAFSKPNSLALAWGRYRQITCN